MDRVLAWQVECGGGRVFDLNDMTGICLVGFGNYV